ncbi:MAG TPA: transglycosylase SLT domain-containing protein [Gemmatimonadales bacterium]|nr:transglycosylase SLT domain-containing protein [Gemmatimonadales bacterium]
MRLGDGIVMAGLSTLLAGCGHRAPQMAPIPVPATGMARAAPAPVGQRIARPLIRPVRVDSLRLEAALFREGSAAPLARVLSRRSGNDIIADRAAAALLRESRRLGLSPSFAAAVMLVENTPMDTTAVSAAGAIGLMQVMPVHEGSWGCDVALTSVESNICHGTHVLHMYLGRNRSVERALRWYNGCVGRRTTRACRKYPSRVLRLASSIRRELLNPHAATRSSPSTSRSRGYLRSVKESEGSSIRSTLAMARLMVMEAFAW